MEVAYFFEEKNMKFMAFTLAEILIVIAVIGTIATMTVPTLLRGVIQNQWRSSYQKAYNTISNLYSAERAGGAIPYANNENSVITMFKAMNAHLSIKDYAKATTEDKVVSEPLYDNNDYYVKVNFNDDGNEENTLKIEESKISPWIITDDNMAYCVIAGEGCSTKEEINLAGSHNNAIQKACVVVIVDVNGLNNGPNRVEPQILSANQINQTRAIDTLTGDRFYIYVGLNGITAGSKKSTVTGRIVSDLK